MTTNVIVQLIPSDYNVKEHMLEKAKSLAKRSVELSFNDKWPNHAIVRQTPNRRIPLTIASGIIPRINDVGALTLGRDLVVISPVLLPFRGKSFVKYNWFWEETHFSNKPKKRAKQPASFPLFSFFLDNSRCIPKQTRSVLFFKEVRRFSHSGWVSKSRLWAAAQAWQHVIPWLNSFQHEIRLNHVHKRLHCTVYPGIRWWWCWFVWRWRSRLCFDRQWPQPTTTKNKGGKKCTSCLRDSVLHGAKCPPKQILGCTNGVRMSTRPAKPSGPAADRCTRLFV